MSNLYGKLAKTNLFKNKQIYLPYFISGCVIIASYYNMLSISRSEGLEKLSGSYSLIEMLGFGTYIMRIFSVILLFYINSFLIKRRKKEMGLYSILGLEKKHISLVFFFESLYVSFSSIFFGLITGAVFSKFLFLILENILKLNSPIEFSLSAVDFLDTAKFFSIIYLVLFLVNLFIVNKSNPIELLKGSNMGEKVPKGNIFLAILGIIFISLGYGLSITIDEPLKALTTFFIAVLFVIFATYLLFTSGSISFLKFLKSQKTIYYKPENFINISGLMFRMKQNATGLASICILSTMVIITISTTFALYLGSEDTINKRFSHDAMITLLEKSDSDLQNEIEVEAEKIGVKLENKKSYKLFQVAGKIESSNIKIIEGEYNFAEDYFISIIETKDYNNAFKKDYVLNDKEVLIYGNKNISFGTDLNLMGNNYKIKNTISDIAKDFEVEGFNIKNIIIILNNINVFEKYISKDGKAKIMEYFYFDMDGTQEAKDNFIIKIYEIVKSKNIRHTVDIKELRREDIFKTNSGFLFIGCFLGSLFVIATALIIYYKQVTEGYEDRIRFKIMENIGLSKLEVKKIIRSQISTVFALPIFTAIIHTAFASFIIQKLLLLFGLYNKKLIFTCIGFSALAFVIVYFAIYFLTAKTYYDILEE